jgi:CcmD family protein
LEGIYKFLSNNTIFIVAIIVFIVWAGIFFYLNNLDKRLKNIEKVNKGENNEK